MKEMTANRLGASKASTSRKKETTSKQQQQKSLPDGHTMSSPATAEEAPSLLDHEHEVTVLRPPTDVNKVRRTKVVVRKSLNTRHTSRMATATPSEEDTTTKNTVSISKNTNSNSNSNTHSNSNSNTHWVSATIPSIDNPFTLTTPTNNKEDSRHPSPSSRQHQRPAAAAAAGKASRRSLPSDVSANPSQTQSTATGLTRASCDIKFSSERLEVLAMQLRETTDEKEAATIVLEFALRIKNHELVVSGADHSIINAMKRFSNSHKIQTRGCKALAEMASKGLTNIESIIDKGGSEIILTAMDKHRAEEDLQKEACRAIEVITKNSNQGKQSFGVHAKGAIVAILNCMRDHPSSAKLQRLTCRALAGIAAGHTESSQTIVSEGGLDSIRRTLKNHDDNPEVIENAFDILINIASAVNKCSLDEEIAMTISMDRILATMLLYRQNDKMQSQGMALLCILCKASPRNRAKVASLFGLEVVTKSLENCINNKEVLRHGTTLIQNLCQSEGNAVAAGLVSEGGMELLLNIIRRHGSDAVIVQQIFLVVAKMARPFSEKIRKEGGIELILSGMRRHDENINVQEAACLALWKLSSKKENANIINSNGGVSLINAALARFSTDNGMSEVACEALASLSLDKEMLIAHQTLKARKVATAAHKKAERSWGCGVSCF